MWYDAMISVHRRPEGVSLMPFSPDRIVGMYTTIVLLVSKMLRGHFEDVSATIMFDDMPNVDRILQVQPS